MDALFSYRHKNETNCLILMRSLLILSQLNESVFNYLFFLPPLIYKYAKFSDFMRVYLDNLFEDFKRSYHSYMKEDLAKEINIMLQSYETRVLLTFEKYQNKILQ